MKNKKNSKINLIIVFSLLIFASLTIASKNNISQDAWIVPPVVKKMKNPTDPADKDGLFTAKSLYMKNCKSCHGKTGKGDGPNAKELKTPSGDFSAAEFQSQTGGELFYKIKEGRFDMPSFKKIITEDENIWFVVNYLRTF